NTRYAIYWDPPDIMIGEIDSDGVGRIASFTYTVPITAATGAHQVAVDLQGAVVARSSFNVID
ncbi:MAG: hypothetical protein JXA89_23195, partial [Anaerolineae bacterium]|nr:hypothetical protein [Anaerolineae bacterium]